ncbi:50S ribosomal protein L11 methyltransferase [Qipengyuania flava]|nr:50S ribosomal protein L11 methyltransferase [Qipengyuania flava]MBY5965819.1 50S ribosomal protein L11 methyltransferase [Qipengyuania flava]MBY6012143.1 50S ribosomal protein L11 methyltransferase [Qipengyuania flava]MBY6026585.1 50S ribosomal protein L11 methyltransferase [Qipengyuania flava]
MRSKRGSTRGWWRKRVTDAWKIYAEVSKPVAKAALVAHEDALDWPADWVVTGMEVADHLPDEWTFEVYLDHRPSEKEMARVAALFEDGPPEFTVEKLPETDWVTESQKGVDPIRAGRFHVRTPDHQPDPELVDFVIPASQAFGTGQHETTAGCLAMLDLMKREGVVSRNHIDVGTGTGLLAFAAMELWPHARATASDIDPVCAGVVRDNMVGNFVPEGDGPGELTMVIADGMEAPLLRLRGPYDLFIANILAGPLVELAPSFAQAIAPGGNLLLAGLLETQEPRVRRAYRALGFRLSRRLINGDWSILWLRKSRVR